MIELMANETKIDLDPFRTILEWIIEDEKRHGQILNMIEKALTKTGNR